MNQPGGSWLEWDERGVPRRIAVDRPITIGRVPGNDIEVDDQAVSRHHCVVSPGPGYVLVDASRSTNLVVSGGRQLATLQLRAGESFSVGPVRFEVSGGASVGDGAGALGLQWSDAAGPRQLAVTAPVTIGRMPGNGIVLTDEQVSRHHAVVTPLGGALNVDASASANGIRVDGRQEKQARVGRGSRFSIGQTPFQVVQVPVGASGGMRQQPGAVSRPSPAMFGALAAAACVAVVVVVAGVVMAGRGSDDTRGVSGLPAKVDVRDPSALLQITGGDPADSATLEAARQLAAAFPPDAKFVATGKPEVSEQGTIRTERLVYTFTASSLESRTVAVERLLVRDGSQWVLVSTMVEEQP